MKKELVLLLKFNFFCNFIESLLLLIFILKRKIKNLFFEELYYLNYIN